ncbi:ROK family transcriptional regulator [Consotaella aegiceratis]|uniref:ROK family transcriptional regulator n=1 Tax=Consotaella aegiceratis TaxID=3097961 RepID=UPI002F3F6775
MNSFAGSNSELAADHNRGVILRTIQRYQPLSRTELAQRTGLTKQAVARIAGRLIADGLVIEAGRRHGAPGQPAIELEIDPAGACAVGIGMARDHVTFVALDAAGTMRGRLHYDIHYILPDQFFELTQEALATFRHRRLVDPDRLAGIGLAIPDWLGEIPFPKMPAEFTAWDRVDVRQRFAEFTTLPIFIDNDATAATIGELNYGLGVESRSFFYIFIGSGLGGGVVLDGVCYHGTGGLSGEIGWMPALVADKGRGGSVEPLGQVISLFILYEFLAEHGIEISHPHQLLLLDRRGRDLVSQWLRDKAVHLAEAAIQIGLLIDPDAILTGGRLPIRLIDELLVNVHDHLAQSGRKAPPIYRAAGSENAAALGAATMPLAEVLRLEARDRAQRTRLPHTGHHTVAGDLAR